MTTNVVPFEDTKAEGSGPQQHPASADLTAQRLANSVQGKYAKQGKRTARKRARRDRKLYRCERRYRTGMQRMRQDSARLNIANGTEATLWTTARESPDTASPVDRGRRGLSNRAYLMILALVWVINVPIGISTFQIFEEPMVFTVLLALFADTVVLLSAHGSGVTLRRNHLEQDGWLGLGLEVVLGWLMFALGFSAALASAWARWRYLQLTGSGNTVGIVFSTILMVLTFVVAVWAAWSHYQPYVADAEKGTRNRSRIQKNVLHDDKVINRVRAQTRAAFNDRRHLAQQIVAQADRILAHYCDMAIRSGVHLKASEPEWLRHERRLARLPDDGAMVQPVTFIQADVFPQIASMADDAEKG